MSDEELIAEARREAFRRYDGDRIIDENTGEDVAHDDWGYADTARQAFIAGVAWLAEHDRQVAERAWDEAVEETHALGWLHDFAKSDALARNPHRAAKGEQK